MNQDFWAMSYLVVVGGAVVVVSRVVPGSEAVEKIRSVKSGKTDEVVAETVGAVTLGGAMVFIR